MTNKLIDTTKCPNCRRMMRPTVIEKTKYYEVGECPLCGWSPFKDEKSGIKKK